MGGQFFPNGQGTAVDGGYRLSGSWSFGSGTGHSEYVAAGFLPMDDGEMRWISEGIPDMQVAVVPRDEISFNDGWYVQGLKGTGSYDYSAEDVFVPERRTFALFVREPRRGTSPATRMGLMPVTAAGHASWALGVAKSMLDDVQELAATKFRMSDMASLASRPTFQKGLAHHVAAWRAARLLVLDAFTTAEAAVAVGRRADPRFAGRHARRRGVCHRCRAEMRRMGPPGRRHELNPRRHPPRARVPRHVHRHAARLYQREGGHRRGADLAWHHRRPVRPLIRRAPHVRRHRVCDSPRDFDAGSFESRPGRRRGPHDLHVLPSVACTRTRASRSASRPSVGSASTKSHGLSGPPTTVAQRLVRAKRQFASPTSRWTFRPKEEFSAPSRFGPGSDLPALQRRLHGAPRRRPDPPRSVRRGAEARPLDCGLTRDDRPRAHALVALMAFHAARLPARVDDTGELVLLDHQDRARWDQRLIGLGFHHLDRCAEAHSKPRITCKRRSPPRMRSARIPATPWPRILELYDALLRVAPTPVVMLNRVVALARVSGAEAALRELHTFERDPS